MLKDAWPIWNPDLKNKFSALSAELEKFTPLDVTAALNQQGQHHLQKYLQGIKKYQTHPFKRAPKNHEVVWQEGTTKLLRVGDVKKDARAILAIPSLINRYYILDLLPGYSFLDALSDQGFNVYVIDWDAPGETETNFILADYVTKRLIPAVTKIEAQNAKEIILLGYCMGGVLTTALCQLLGDKIKAHVALATPWEFANSFPLWSMAFQQGEAQTNLFLDNANQLPADMIQSLFWSLDPVGAKTKFEKFADADTNSTEAELFVALEDWLNDNVPLVKNVAKECLIGWYGRNELFNGKWMVNGTAIDLKKITTPTYVMIPENDKIVPPQSAAPLAAELMSRVKATPPLGHVGLMVSRHAKELAWAPLFDWLKQYVKVA